MLWQAAVDRAGQWMAHRWRRSGNRCFELGLMAVDSGALLVVVLAASAELPRNSSPWLGMATGLAAIVLIHGTAHAMGLYRTATLALLGQGSGLLLVTGFSAVAGLVSLALALGSPSVGIRIGVASLSALAAAAAFRLALAVWAKRQINSLAERVVLVGTASSIDRLLRTGLISPTEPRLAGWIAIGDEGVLSAARAFPILGWDGEAERGHRAKPAIDRLLSVHPAGASRDRLARAR